MSERILEFARSQGLAVEQAGGDAYKISLNKEDQCRVVVTVPRGCFEWFIEVQSPADGAKLFTDWDDTYGDGDLEKIRASGVVRFLECCLGNELRIAEVEVRSLLPWRNRTSTSKRLEFRTAAGWQEWGDVVYPEEED